MEIVMGKVAIDLDRLVLVFDVMGGNEVDLDECRTQSEINDWVEHLQTKVWASEILCDFLRAVRYFHRLSRMAK